MIQPVADPDLEEREGALSGAVSSCSLDLLVGTRLPVDARSTPVLDRRVG